MSGGNTSTAVMARRVEAHDSLDDFPTPPWATRALVEVLVARGLAGPGMTCREPAANRGFMVRPLAEFFRAVEAADVHDYGAGFPVRDYLWGEDPAPVGWTVTNPPFRLAEQFIGRALRTSAFGVAVLLRLAFAEGVGRFDRLFGPQPPQLLCPFAERVVLHRGRLAPEGSTATAYAWFVWHADLPARGLRRDTVVQWIAPCRGRLERDGDYPAAILPAGGGEQKSGVLI